MKTTAICPISDKRINENVARGNATLTVLFLTAFVITSKVLLIVFLLIDFLLRGMELSRYSPFAIICSKVVKLLGIKPKIINAGPKLFAARIGLFFSLTILVSSLSGLEITAYILTGVFGVCAFLEAFFGYCVACKIYPFVYRTFYAASCQQS